MSLVDPQGIDEPKLTHAYITYQLDGGSVVRTAAKEYTFAGLSPGYHHVYAQLASLDGIPVGARYDLTVYIPK